MKLFVEDVLNAIFVIFIFPLLIAGAVIILALLMVASPVFIAIELIEFVIGEHRRNKFNISSTTDSFILCDDINITNE